MKLIHKQAELLQQQTSFVVATIVQIEGSAPRGIGAKMLITVHRNIFDTIGGGAFEAAVIDRAITLIQSEGAPELYVYILGPEYGMRCGGRVTVFLEPSPLLEQVMIFGAGHVAKPLAALTHLLGFHTVIIDDRPEFNNPERFPQAQELIQKPVREVLSSLSSNPSTYVVILTRDAELDYEILDAYITQPAKYLGMIGSQTKLESFRAKLKQSGKDPSILKQVYSPIGVNIEAETPEEIAISIAAQLVLVRRSSTNPKNTPTAKTSKT